MTSNKMPSRFMLGTVVAGKLMPITMVLVPVKPCESVAVMVTVKLPKPVGVPVIAPLVDKLRPEGKVPPVTA